MRTLQIVAPAALILAVAACGDEPAPETEAGLSVQAVPVRTVRAQASTDAPRLLSSGILSSRSEMELSFKIPGYVEAVHVREGQRVQAGQVLATLQTAEVDAQVRAAQAQALRAAQNLARMERLVRDSVMAPVRLEEAREASERAEAGLVVAEFNQRHATVRAPSAGRILRLHAEASEYMGPGAPVLRFGAESGGWEVGLEVPDHQVVKIREGSAARLTFSSLPGLEPLLGRVSEISDGADPRTGTFRVEVAFASPADLPLRSGMVVRAEIELTEDTERDDVLVSLPMSALVDGDGAKAAVFVVDGGVAKRIEVQVSTLTGAQVQVRSDRIVGQPVVVAGAPYLRDGSAVSETGPFTTDQEPRS